MAKDKSHEDEIRAGLAALRERGVALDAAAGDLVPRLTAEFGKGRATDLAIIFSLGKIVDPAALAALQQIERRASDKDSKKEIKRALFKLAQKGLALSDEETTRNKAATPLFTSEPEIEAFMSSVDGGGGRLIWIAKAQPSRGLQVIQAMLHDREGLLRFGGMHIRRKELRKMAGFKFTPILMLTTESAVEKKQAGKEAGATGWIVKPFNPEILLKTIAKVLPA